MTTLTERQDWHVSSDGLRYPKEPWHLAGQFVVSTFVVSRRSLGALLEIVPAGERVIGGAGRIFVGVAFVDYAPRGVLSYRELLVALPVISRHGVRYSIPLICVDSAQSRVGGRELWAIPKELASFDWREGGGRVHARMSQEGREVASVETGGRVALPGRWPLPLPTAQTLDGRTIYSRNAVRARPSLVSARWKFASDGPLGFLAGARPLISVSLTDADVAFGVEVERASASLP
ncbi:MAG: acetoacetate decarboxylase family protein [Gemmatimonadaceae bacterium]